MAKSYKSQRIRDSIHGLITFDNEAPHAAIDQLAWRLINTPEMQRLRRVKQLGLSEFTFPGATHTRFSHSLGVFHVSRSLVGILTRLLPPAERVPHRAEVAVIAALLHDLGHGPLSHAFESVQKARGHKKDHEDWTADIIASPTGSIYAQLEGFRRGFANDVAVLLRAKFPEDAFHAIVSSSFDADRLDYLRRDRLMTGTGAGAIDFDWLLDNLGLGEIVPAADDADDLEPIKTFCIKKKALQAAESFILARYHLFEQVYLHKTTRGMEKIAGKVIDLIATHANEGSLERIGLDRNDPLGKFFLEDGGRLEHYLALDDSSVWSAAQKISSCEDNNAAMHARRLLNRSRLYCLDFDSSFPRRVGETLPEAEGRWHLLAQKVDALGDVPKIKDVVSVNAYGAIGADQTRAHKRLSILVDNGVPQEIVEVSDLVRVLQQRQITRYYFDTVEARQRAMEVCR